MCVLLLVFGCILIIMILKKCFVFFSLQLQSDIVSVCLFVGQGVAFRYACTKWSGSPLWQICVVRFVAEGG